MPVRKKLGEILNVKPSCTADLREKATGTICTLLKSIKKHIDDLV